VGTFLRHKCILRTPAFWLYRYCQVVAWSFASAKIGRQIYINRLGTELLRIRAV